MKKIFLALALSAAACVAGCSDNEEVGYDIDSKLLLPKSGLQQIDLTETSTRVDYNVWVYRSGYNDGRSTATLTVDAKALADYNAANGTSYVLMPEAYYDLPAATVRLGNNDNTGKVSVTLDVSAITAGSLYVLPITVGSPDTAISESGATVLLHPVRPEAEEPENAG